MSEEDNRRPSRASEVAESKELPSDLVIKSALVRTQLAAENTLMAWIRTAVSLYTFGFTISKFFEYLAEQKGAKASAGPRVLGIALICTGVVALLLALVEHVHTTRKLGSLGLPAAFRFSLPAGTAAVLAVIGVIALASIVLHWPM